MWTSSATVVHIMWFAILRFISIQWPHDFKQFIGKYSKVNIKIIEPLYKHIHAETVKNHITYLNEKVSIHTYFTVK